MTRHRIPRHRLTNRTAIRRGREFFRLLEAGRRAFIASVGRLFDE